VDNSKSIPYRNDNRLYIPTSSNSQLRISEQELKFVFLEKFLADKKFKSFLYSPETPTKHLYRFSEKGKRSPDPKCVSISQSDKDGRKANIDLCIFNRKKERVAIIEFKANNAGVFEHKKDLVKLVSEPIEVHISKPPEDLVCMFIHIYSSTDDNTLDNIYEKTLNYESYISEGKVIYMGYSLNHKGRDCKLNKGIITWSKIKSKFVINELSLED